ncbi:ribosome-recycling factor, mitochondrial [Ischnura elegans]|uniref:ribosome-recycling factor, mitochondrial n=1 Tax=Ischnura elegans TaxID=197161 RepID=UPI001ED89F27|nr:ribosome-recycling factor, mitochondrial [Ischnura elegans]
MSSRNKFLRLANIGLHHLEYLQAIERVRLSTYAPLKCLSSQKKPSTSIISPGLPLNNGDRFVTTGPWKIFFRSYAKGKDRKKSEKGKKDVPVNEAALSELINLEGLKNQMQKSVDTMKDEYVKNLSLRSTTGSFETLRVKFEGTEHTLQDLAQIIRKNPKTIVVNMSAFPQAIPSVLEAISKSGMNLNPQQDGTTLYIPVPKVTKEHRENLSKNAKSLFIKCRDSIKDVQNKFMKNLKNKDHVSSDDVFSAQQQILSLSKTYVSQAESIMEAKQKELLGKD